MTTAERRLSAIEGQLSPTGRVVAWLEEAHAYDGLNAYVDAEMAKVPAAMPLDRLVRATIDAARVQNRGLPAIQAAEAQDRAVLGTIFRFQVALGIVSATHEALDRELYLQVIVASQLAMAAGDSPRAGEERSSAVASARDLAFLRVTELMALEAARTGLEVKYLGGHTALFPGLRRDWDAQLHDARSLAVGAMRLAELDGLAEIDPALLEPTAKRIAQRTQWIIAPAKVKTFDAVGDGARTRDAIADWLGRSG